MLNLGTYRHMTPERYQRYLNLLDRLKSVDETRLLPVQRIYLLLDEEDREPQVRHAMVSCLRRDRILLRQSSLPVRYQLRKAALSEAAERIRNALEWHEVTHASNEPHLVALIP